MPAASALKIMREEASAGMWDASLIERLGTVLERLK
jgi:hypothetical protein